MKMLLADSVQTQLHFPLKDLIKSNTSLHTVSFLHNGVKQPLSTDRKAHRCPLMKSCKLYAPPPSISLLILIRLPDIPCHAQWKKIFLRTNVHVVSIPTERPLTFLLLFAIHLKAKKVGYYDCLQTQSKDRGLCEICSIKTYQATGK